MASSPLGVRLNRRGFLATTIAGGLALAGCSNTRTPSPAPGDTPAG